MVLPFHSCYRIQMRQGIDFAYVAKTLDYFRILGISHLYLSPIFKSAVESNHGYDVADPTQICELLGGYKGFVELVNQAHAYNIGIILDIVPNHMVADSAVNQWWNDVLECGVFSRYAQFFSMRHEKRAVDTPAQYILPVLNQRFQIVLANRDLKLEICDNGIYLCYANLKFPINLLGIELLLRRASTLFASESITQALNFLERFNSDFYNKPWSDLAFLYQKVVLEFKLNYLTQIKTQIDWQSVFKVCYESEDFIRELMRIQFYQLVYWQHANRFLNYRRFFNINDLVAIRVEDPIVFEITHALIIDLCKQGLVDGLRIDHVDGLRYPTEYLNRLKRLLPNTYIIVEKILHPDEKINADWPVSGTTGYDFLARLDQVFVDPNSQQLMDHIYFNFIGEKIDSHQLKLTIKNHVLNADFYADFSACLKVFLFVLESYGENFDYTESEISHFLMTVLINMEVYRTYSDGKKKSKRHYIHYWRKTLRNVYISIKQDYRPLFARFSSIIFNSKKSASERVFVEQLQLLLPPLSAKGIEDTFFYRYHRLVCLNEVGGFPESYGTNIETFYSFLAIRQKNYPKSLSCTTTHDTKRSEDVRSRMLVMSQEPIVWNDFISDFLEIIREKDIVLSMDRNSLYGMLQNLIGCFPIGKTRFKKFVVKFLREANVYSSWVSPNEKYESECLKLVDWIFSDRKMQGLLQETCEKLSYKSFLISLGKVLIKFTAPGVPDIYQGHELMCYQLVDPDNRLPVNFDFLQSTLEKVITKGASEILASGDRSHVKMWLTRLCLQCRKEFLNVFLEGAFHKIDLNTGSDIDIISYTRGKDILVLVPRFCLDQSDLSSIFISLPSPNSSEIWYDAINEVTVSSGRYSLQYLWPILPFSLFTYKPLAATKVA